MSGILSGMQAQDLKSEGMKKDPRIKSLDMEPLNAEELKNKDAGGDLPSESLRMEALKENLQNGDQPGMGLHKENWHVGGLHTGKQPEKDLQEKNPQTGSILEVRNLSIYKREDGRKLVDGVDIVLGRGECLGIVGESGSGKTITLKSLVGLLPAALYESCDYKRTDVRMGMIFQDPVRALDPLCPVGKQLIEIYTANHSAKDDKNGRKAVLSGKKMPAGYGRTHTISGTKDRAIHDRVIMASGTVRYSAYAAADGTKKSAGIPGPENGGTGVTGLLSRLRACRRLSGLNGEAFSWAQSILEELKLPAELIHEDRLPRTLSGGQCQRICIAMALARDPEVLLSDEPTTALDVTVQKRIMELLKKLQRERGFSMIFVTHDLMAASLICDRIMVMKDGRIIEEGPVSGIMEHPAEEYTRRLVGSVLTVPGRLQ